MLRNVALLLSFVSVVSAHAGKAWFTESELPKAFEETIYPFFSSMPSGVLQMRDGVRLTYRKYEVPNERGAIVLVHGYNQSQVLFAELLYGFVQSGYSVYIADARGMGFSQRLISDPKKAWVGDFYDYVWDLDSFINRIVKATPHRNLFLLGHSMGGGVAGLYEAMFPGRFQAVVLSAPMMEVPTGGFGEVGGLLWSRVRTYSFGSTTYAPGQGKREPSDVSFEDQNNTHSRARYDVKQACWRKFPGIRIRGATYGWVTRAIAATRWLRDHASAKWVTPTLMLQAEMETVVVKDAQAPVCDATPLCRRLEIPGTYHEILWETDGPRDRALGEIEAFLKQHSR